MGLDAARRERIIGLLGLIVCDLPEPTRRSHATAGFVHDQRVRESCPDCLANDRTMFGCETCGGRGYTETRRTRDPYAIDKTQPYGISPDRHEAERARDIAIEQLGQRIKEAEQSKADELAAANDHGYSWEESRRRLYKRFHVAECERALELLHEVDERAYAILYAVHVYGWVEASATTEAAVERGLRILDALLPHPLKAPGAPPAPKLAEGRVARTAGRSALEERDAEIRRAILEVGIPTADVARTWGISTRQVNRIVASAAA